MMESRHLLTIIHPVPDVDRWTAVLLRESAKDRPRRGLLRRKAYRSLDDPNEVMVQLEFDSAESAQAFLPSIDLRGLLDEIGLEIYPPVFIGVEIDELRVDDG
jgi:hypothetical protein